MKVVIAIPARNSEKTLETTFNEIPLRYRNCVILSDDGSTDSTSKIAHKLGIKVFKNSAKYGYGSNLKNCFKNALNEGAEIVIILHSDNQYDATKIPALANLIEEGKTEFVIGSRILGDKANGMSAFRFFGNRALGFAENFVMGTKLTDLHSGLIAVKADLLRSVPFELNSDDYGFHTDLILQSHYAGARFAEVGIPTRYDNISTSISIYKSIVYGFDMLITLSKYMLHKYGIKKIPQFSIKKLNRVRKFYITA